MGCIGSRVHSADSQGSSPEHIGEQTRPLLKNPSVNASSPVPSTVPIVSSDGVTSQSPAFRDGGQTTTVDGAPRSYDQALANSLANSPANGPRASLDENSMSFATDSLVTNRNGIAMNSMGLADVQTPRGNEILANLKKAYEWKDNFDSPSQQFLSLMDRLYMECQLHLTALSSQGELGSKREADVIVNEMITVRNHWGPRLLPSSICNAFVRERITLTLGVEQRKFRIDCAQFFEPVPFYGPSSSQNNSNHGELMKLYRFSVYDLSRNEVILRYYLERSNVTQVYHVLCFTCENYRGQVQPYGTESPSYWEVRGHMLKDVYSRLLSALSQGSVPAPQTHASTIFPASRGEGPVIIQVPASQPLTALH